MSCQRRSPLHTIHAYDRSTSAMTYHGHRVLVISGLGVPLHRDLAGGASVGTVVAGLARLVGAHGPTGVLLVGSNSDKTSLAWELALAALLHQNGVSGVGGTDFVVTSMAVAVTSLNARNEGDERGLRGELHFGFERATRRINLKECKLAGGRWDNARRE